MGLVLLVCGGILVSFHDLKGRGGASKVPHVLCHCGAEASLVLTLQEMNEDHSTPKKEKQERISKHKENLQHTQAEEEAQLLSQQRLYYDKNCRFFKRKTMIKRHEMEQQNIREVWHSSLLSQPVFTALASCLG